MRSSSLRRLPAARHSQGVGLVTAIFLLVVLAGLGVAMVTIFTSQKASSALDLQGARAYQAARAGIEWGLFVQSAGNCNPDPAGTSFDLPGNSSLAGFSVTVWCRATPTGAVLRAIACNMPDAAGACVNPANHADYVQRTMEVER
jgi:MSHA biogenesis protein MshP